MPKAKLRKPKKTIWLSLLIAIAAVIGLMSVRSKIEDARDSKMPEQTVVNLTAPSFIKGKTLMAALKDRRTGRNYDTKRLSLEDLSGILWAANGLNRPDEDKHTAPTARNVQNMDLYAFTPDGVYLYNAKANKLVRIKETDERAKTAVQDFAKTAPLNIVIVATYGKMQNAPMEHEKAMALMGAGYISQNIYLYAAAFDLETVARAMIDKQALKEVLNLNENQEALLAHSVGYPREEN